jgi:hypothetical protein
MQHDRLLRGKTGAGVSAMSLQWTGPPGRKRERRPATNETAHLENDLNNGNSGGHSASRILLQARREIEARGAQ